MAAGRVVGVAQYYFHLMNGGDSLIDPEGRDIADPSAIPAAALQDARHLMSHDMLKGEINFGCTIEVRDEAGKVIHDLSFRDAVKISG